MNNQDLIIKSKLEQIYSTIKDFKYKVYNYKLRKFIDSSDDFNNCKTLLPKETLKYKCGSCYDTTILICYLGKKLRFKTSYNLFVCIEDIENPSNVITHTCSVLCTNRMYNKQYYYIEQSFTTNKGIHGPFKSLKELVKFQSKLLKEEYKINVYPVVIDSDISKFYYRQYKYSYFGKLINTWYDNLNKK